jgi:DNA-binding XRE family transcriptional regulator
MLGICALRVERHIPLKMRLRGNCIQFVNQLVANSAPETLPEHVRQKRTALKLSQWQLGDLLGLRHETISKVELGYSRMQRATSVLFEK